MNIYDSLSLKVQMSIPAFDLGSLIESIVAKAKSYGSGFIIFLGIIMIVVAAFKLGKGMMTQGKPNAQPINWFLCIGLFLIGGSMAYGGFNAMANISKSIGSTADDLANEENMFNSGDEIDETSSQW